MQWHDVPAETDLLKVRLFEQALAAGPLECDMDPQYLAMEHLGPGGGGEPSGPAGQPDPVAAAVPASCLGPACCTCTNADFCCVS